MAILNRLPTRDRLASWGMVTDTDCVLCGFALESRDHLFFGCFYSKEIWKKILELCQLQRLVGSWTEELTWAVTKLKGKSLITLILKLAWHAHLYLVWKERNSKFFGGKCSTPVQVVAQIKNLVCGRLDKLKRIHSDSINIRLCLEWGITVSVFDM
ncbi:hypothetical protein REPUB_Repub02eG0026000 [Reevesia pubescens]